MNITLSAVLTATRVNIHAPAALEMQRATTATLLNTNRSISRLPLVPSPGR